jgi:hypothetical protein
MLMDQGLESRLVATVGEPFEEMFGSQAGDGPAAQEPANLP